MGSHADLCGFAKMIMRTQLGPNSDVSFYKPSLTSFVDYLPPLSPLQTDATLLNVTCCVRLHTLLHVVGCCCVLLRKV